jgi:hypothetical protein
MIGDPHRDKKTDEEGLTTYAAEMGSGAMIYSYIPSFIEIGSGIRKSIRGDTQTH